MGEGGYKYDDSVMPKSKYVYLPKLGKDDIFHLVGSRKVDDPPDSKYQFVRKKTVKLPNGEEVKVDEKLGYHFEYDLESGQVLSVTNESAWDKTFIKHSIGDGKWHIRHVAIGKWEVKKLDI